MSNHRYFWFSTSEEVLLTASKTQAKIPTENGVRRALLFTFPLRKKGLGTLEIALRWYKTQRYLIFGINSADGLMFDSLWHFITKCDRHYYKMRQTLLQNATDSIIKCDRQYYKMRQLLYYKMLQVVLLQNETAIETCDIYYKIRRYNETCSPKYQRFYTSVNAQCALLLLN